jgi:hypothetical protein
LPVGGWWWARRLGDSHINSKVSRTGNADISTTNAVYAR